jgi:two-component system CheB/CheR fusion protein
MAHLRPGLEIRLRRAIRQALHDDERTVMTDVRVRRGNAWHRVHVTAEPLDESRDLAGVLLVSFVDEPEAAAAVPDAPISLREPDEAIVRQLEDDLRSMREELHGTLEEVQSSNQELRVANEEVMSVNEELRSSNEELETSREELQSLNEASGRDRHYAPSSSGSSRTHGEAARSRSMARKFP